MTPTTIPKHTIDRYFQWMAEKGYEMISDETRKGYMIVCIKSPNDRPKPAKLKLVKG
jgi:hypothetical protein